MGKAQADGLESAPVKGRQSRDLRNGFEMAELTGGGASGTGGDTATGIWYPNRYWKLPQPLTFLLLDGGSITNLTKPQATDTRRVLE